jgi:hypothetical protein
MEQGPECDFCEIPIGEEAELEPIYVGSVTRDVIYSWGECTEPHENLPRVLGKTAGEMVALLDAIDKSEHITINTERETSRVTSDYSIDTVPREYSVGGLSTHNKGQAAASIEVHPGETKEGPDMEVCETCAEMFRSM